MPPEYTASEAAVLLDRQQVNLPYLPGEIPGSDPETDLMDAYTGGVVEPPVPPERVMTAVKRSGALHAVVSAVADGCAGVRYEIVPRFESSSNAGGSGFRLEDRKTWTPEIKKQRDRLMILIQAGFLGRGARSLRSGFREQEFDRCVLGWGGVGILRDSVVPGAKTTMPPMPRGFTRFEAHSARWYRADRKPTMVPVPIALDDGTIFWIEEPRFFRRLRVQAGNGRFSFFKEYGDWRAMDARTGKFSSGNRHSPSTVPGKPGEYRPGKLDRKAVPAGEVMTWRTEFPGTYPYGWSGWHSELDASDAATEHIRLVLSYLKSGLHSVILAAANRPFEQATAAEAIDKVDRLGRGREGLAALVMLSLVPADSATAAIPGAFGDSTSDNGRLVLHELTTRLPGEILNSDGLQSSLASRFSESERIPAILLGRSDSYNFATASAAWSVVNRLRFGPHHEEREAFLDRVLIEMGVTFWRIEIVSPEWGENEPISGMTSTAGQLGGVSINKAMQVFSEVSGTDFKPSDEWWGDIPMTFVTAILNSQDPAQTAALLNVDIPLEDLEKAILPGVMAVLEQIDSKIEAAISKTNPDPSALDDEEDPEDPDQIKRPPGRPKGT